MGIAGLKRYVWHGLAEAYRVSGASRARHRGTVAILAYHRVLSAEDLAKSVVQPGMYVRDDVFRMHMEYLREEFAVVSIAELLERWRTGRWDRQAACCVITFDDGWLDNYRHAFPILKSFQLPASIFLPTDFIGTSRWFWPEQLGYLLRAADAPSCPPKKRSAFYAAIVNGLKAGLQERGVRVFKGGLSDCGSYDHLIERCKHLNATRLERLLDVLSDILATKVPETRILMNWDEVRDMSQHGISFGSHSCSHRLMTHLSEQEVLQEAALSYKKLSESGANVVPVFCYPNGNYDSTAQRALKETGYQAAMSVNEGVEGRVPSDLLALKRISLHNDISDTPALFALAISGIR